MGQVGGENPPMKQNRYLLKPLNDESVRRSPFIVSRQISEGKSRFVYNTHKTG